MLNKDDPVSVEDFIYSPNTTTLVFDGEAAAATLLRQNVDKVISRSVESGAFVVYVNVNDVDRIINAFDYNRNLFPLVLGLLGEAELEASGILQVQRHPYLNLRGNGVLLGFVDTGIDYTQEAFQYEDGSSKIQYIWDQTIRGNPPDGFLYGSEYDNETINLALRSENPFDIVPHRDTVGHGTFLASVAGSRESGRYTGAAPDAEIIVVKLKRATPADYERFLIPRDQENAFSGIDFALGVQYIVDKARELNRPVAICVSLGTNLGLHGGFNRLEEYLSVIAETNGKAVCVAAGNEADAGHHTHGRISVTGSIQNVEVWASDKFEDIYLTLWNYAIDRMSVSITSPLGEQIDRVPAYDATGYRRSLILEQSIVIVEYHFPVERSEGQLTRIKILQATPGIWTITIYGDSILDGSYHMWLPLTGFMDFSSPMTFCVTFRSDERPLYEILSDKDPEMGFKIMPL